MAYELDGEQVRFDAGLRGLPSRKVVGADAKTFVQLDPYTAKDQANVYWREKVLRGADPETFRMIGHDGYAVDARRVYIRELPIKGADPRTFELLGGPYARDARNLYSSFVPIKADRATFEVLWEHFARDAKHVYSSGTPLKNADPKRFQAWPGGYWTDGDRVGWFDSVLKGADAASFVGLNEQYAKDRHRVYFTADVLKGADPRTFVVLSNRYGKDSKQVFYEGQPMKGVAPARFEVISDKWSLARDAHTVYWREDRTQRDAASFRSVDDRYFIDKKQVVRMSASPSIVDGLSASSFRIIPGTGEYVTDGKRVAFDPGLTKALGAGTDKPYLPDADPKTFVDLGDGFARDARRVYFRAQVVKDADPASFVALGRSKYGRDAKRFFHRGKVAKEPGSKKTGGRVGTRPLDAGTLTRALKEALQEHYFDVLLVKTARHQGRLDEMEIVAPVYTGHDSSPLLARRDIVSLGGWTEVLRAAKGRVESGFTAPVTLEEEVRGLSDKEVAEQLSGLFQTLGYPLVAPAYVAEERTVYWVGFERKLAGEDQPERFWHFQEQRISNLLTRFVLASFGPMAGPLNLKRPRKLKELSLWGDESRTAYLNGAQDAGTGLPIFTSAIERQRGAHRATALLTARILLQLRKNKELRRLAGGRAFEISLRGMTDPEETLAAARHGLQRPLEVFLGRGKRAHAALG